MRFVALATDYDGTIARDGRVDDETMEALMLLHASGRRIILVTGRILDDLLATFEHPQLFERIVAENGAVLYDPGTGQTRDLALPPPTALVEELKARGVDPLHPGRVVVGMWHPAETVALEVIRDLGLEMQVSFNKGAVMVLPAGVTKASGLAAALDEMGLSVHNVVGVGDAENDHAFLDICAVSAAVANAVPALMERADIVTEADHGAGVAELARGLIDDDLGQLAAGIERHRIVLGADGGEAVSMTPFGVCALVCGPSGAGKSMLLAGLLEELAAHGYQFCVLDPEGDSEGREDAVVLGDPDRIPDPDEIVQLLDDLAVNVVVNLLGASLPDRPAYLESLLPRLQEMRARIGRPHWIVLDEAHHLMPDRNDAAELTVPKGITNLAVVTVSPDALSRAVLDTVTHVVVVGPEPDPFLATFSDLVGIQSPTVTTGRPDAATLWDLAGGHLRSYVPRAPSVQHRRHRRKFALGELDDESFWFRGPDDKLNLRAQNLSVFVEIARGVDDDTWTWHLRRGDYARWFRDVIGDDELAEVADAASGDEALSPDDGRSRITEAVRTRYRLDND